MTSHTSPRRSRSWDAVADWYAGWSGPHGSHYHTALAIPLMIALLSPRAGESVVDLGCGPGTLAGALSKAGAQVTGIDLSARLIALARRHHSKAGRFLVGDATRAAALPALSLGTFDAASFLLSIQDIEPLEEAIASAARLLGPRGRIAMVMLHPCFRIPRQSGWGWDAGRKLQFRRLDSYLSPLAVPMQQSGSVHTRSYHRPLGAYVEALARHGFAITAMREISDTLAPGTGRAERRARREMPLFLGLRADRLVPP